MFLRSRLLILTAVSAATPALAQRDLKELPPVAVDAEFASFKLAPGLEANLFAQEPLIAKPIQMAWDEKGRLWLAGSAIYPQIKPGQPQTDKIMVVEDTDGDGVADKSTVFYEGLLIPTGILPGDGGAYIANSTELLFMKDTDGDGRADETKVLLSGFGTEDTHHILHSIKRGPDGCIYFNQSVYIHSHVETPYGVRRLSGSGIWQYKPESGRLEVFGMGQVNPWGHIFDKWGQSFTTDGAYGEGINYMFPGATFLCLPNQLPRILKGLNPGQPKQCGLEVISGSHFPEEWQGRLITCDFRGHRVNQFAVSDEGSGFSSQQMEDVLTSTHGAFRPVDVQMGPDGALYIADWYNPIIQHGEVDFRDERRDREHGRIWRITAKGRPLTKLPEFAKLPVPELLGLLDESEQWVRTEAKQELKRRHQKNDAEVAALLANPFTAQDQSEAGKLQLLEVVRLQQDLAPSWENLRPLIEDPDANLRAAGVRLAGTLAVHENTPKEALEEMVAADYSKQFITDPNPRVRLEMVNALRATATANAVELAAKVLDHPMDENLDFALWLTCRQLADVWLPEFTAGRLTFGGNLAHISFALKAAERPEAAGALLTLIQDGRIPAEKAGEAIALIGSLGSAEELSALLAFSENYKGQANVRTPVFEALTVAFQQRKVRTEKGVEAILHHLAPDRVNPSAVRLAGVYKLEQARPSLETFAAKADETGQIARLALAALGGDASREFLMTLAARGGSSAVKAGAVAALVTLDAKAAAPTAAAFLFSAPGADDAGQVFDAVVRQKDGPGALAKVLQYLKLQPEIASAGVRRATGGGGETKLLVEALTVAGSLQPVTQLTPEQVNAMMAEVRMNGDAARGEAIYRRPELQCQVCHAIGAVGGTIGPDMVSIGSSAPVDYLIESLLEPSKKIKEGYHSMIVTTKDGGVHSGFLQREDGQQIFLKDAAGQVSSVPKSEVTERQDNPVSLMPPGLTASLRRDEMIDLVRFLSELGKEGAYKQQADGFIRTWRVLNESDALPQIVNKEGLRGLTQENSDILWMPAYSLVNGELPLEAIPVVKAWQTVQRTVHGEIEVTTPGKVLLRLADPSALRIWVGGQEMPATAEIPLDLPAGKHRITLILDPAARKSAVRAEAVPAPGSPARVTAVGGV